MRRCVRGEVVRSAIVALKIIKLMTNLSNFVMADWRLRIRDCPRLSFASSVIDGLAASVHIFRKLSSQGLHEHKPAFDLRTQHDLMAKLHQIWIKRAHR